MKPDQLLATGKVEVVTKTSRTLLAEVDGESGRHQVRSENGGWICDCQSFHFRHSCSHVDAVRLVVAAPGFRNLRPIPNQRDPALFDITEPTRNP